MGKKKNYVLGILIGLGLAIVVSAVMFIILQPIMASNERVYLYSHCQCLYDNSKFEEFTVYSSYEKYACFGGYEPLDDVETKRASVIDDSVTYTYEVSEWKALEGDTNHKKYEYVYDRYKGSDGSYVEYLHRSDIMTRYYIPSYNAEIKIVKTENDAKLIADNFLKQIGMFKYLDEYTYVGYEYNEKVEWHYISYQRFIAGYPTDSRIYVHIEDDGTVSGYNALNFGKYDKYEKILTKEKIEEARQLLEEKIRTIDIGDLQIKDNVSIISDITPMGEPFLDIHTEYGSCAVSFYVTIK